MKNKCFEPLRTFQCKYFFGVIKPISFQKMSSIKSKLAEFLKNLKSDAMPRAPRPRPRVAKETDDVPTPSTPENQDLNSDDESEEIIIEEVEEEEIKKNKSKEKSSSKANNNGFPKKGKNPDNNGSVNTQATGNVINVVGCNNFRWGNDYYMGATNTNPKPPYGTFDDIDSDEEEPIQKCKLIKQLMEVQTKPEREYLIHVSTNLGKNWKKFFRKLDYADGTIETFEIDNKSYGVSEARYQLLLRWVNNKDEATLGRLATLLWKHEEKRIVKDVAEMYALSKQTDKKK